MSHAIDVSRGERRSDLSQQWALRPDDQRFLSLSALKDQVGAWRAASKTWDVRPGDILIDAGEDEETLTIHCVHEEDRRQIIPNNWSFQSLARAAGAPASYLQTLPPVLAAAALEYSYQVNAEGDRQFYVDENKMQLRAITSTRYGRIYDEDIVNMIMRVAGDGTGDTHWKVPGCIDWGSMRYDPDQQITKQSTTLYASDRDCWIFLCDDRNPIEVGKLDNGDPDLLFRGFYVWNSEVGARTFGIATMYLRGICANRCLWGVEGFNEISFRHTSGAPERFPEAVTMLEGFADAKASRVIEGVKRAKALTIGKDDDEAVEWMTKDIPMRTAKALLPIALASENRPLRSVWDASQALTSYARDVPFTDARIDLERTAGAWLDKATA